MEKPTNLTIFIKDSFFKSATNIASIFNPIVNFLQNFDESCMEQQYCRLIAPFLIHNLIKRLYNGIVYVCSWAAYMATGVFSICATIISNMLNLITDSLLLFLWAAYKLYTIWYDTNVIAIDIILMTFRTVYNAPSNIYNTIKSIDLKAIITDILTPEPSSSSLFPDNSYMYRVEKVVYKIWHKIECYSLPENLNCVLGITSIPANCYLYKVSPIKMYDATGEIVEKFTYTLTKVVIPAAGFIYPITYMEPKLTSMTYVIEKLFPSKKMMICSIEPQPVTRFQMAIDLLRRVVQFEEPTVSYKLNAAIQCVQSRTGERNYMAVLCKL